MTADAIPNTGPDDLAECLTGLAELEVAQMRLKAKLSAHWRKYENLGVDKKEALSVHAMSKMTKEERDAKRRIRDRYEHFAFDFDKKTGQGSFAAAMESRPERSPTSLSMPERRLSVARAHTDGYNTGKAGGDATNCPHNPGTEEYVAWHDSWGDAQDDWHADDNSEAKAKAKEKAEEKAEEKAKPTRKVAEDKKKDAAPKRDRRASNMVDIHDPDSDERMPDERPPVLN
jgi:hypothetical protein